MHNLLSSFSHFTNGKNTLPFVEMVRRAMKKVVKKRGASLSYDFSILRAIKSITEINSRITCGDWTQAAIYLMNLSSAKLNVDNEALFNTMPTSWKTRVLEYAAVIIFLLKFRVAYLPDYCLSYLDHKSDFEAYYGDDEDIQLKRK